MRHEYRSIGFLKYREQKAGESESFPSISATAGKHFKDAYFKTTNVGALETYGDYMSLQSGGTGTGYVYAHGLMAKSVTGGYVAELGAAYYKTQLTAGTVTGQCYVGFFEMTVDAGVANMPSGGVIQLVDIVNGSLNAVHGYISIRTYGTTPFSNLFNIADHTSGSGKLFYESTLKMRIGTTSYYIPLSTTERGFSLIGGIIVGVSGAGHDVTFYGDTAGCDFFWDQNGDTNGSLSLGATGGSKGVDFTAYGATNGAYLQWDQSADRLNVVTASGRAITGEEHAVDVTNGGTVSSGDSMVGINVVTTASGAAGSWVSAFYAKTVQASKVVNGYLCGAEIELQSTAAGASDNSVLVLNSTRNHTGSPPACDPYITLREYGTTYANVFFRVFGDTGQGTTAAFSASTLITSAQNTYEADCNVAVRCMSGSTVFWLLGSTTAPTA